MYSFDVLTFLKKDYRYLYIILIALGVTYYFHNNVLSQREGLEHESNKDDKQEKEDYTNFIDSIMNNVVLVAQDRTYSPARNSPIGTQLRNSMRRQAGKICVLSSPMTHVSYQKGHTDITF